MWVFISFDIELCMFIHVPLFLPADAVCR